MLWKSPKSARNHICGFAGSDGSELNRRSTNFNVKIGINLFNRLGNASGTWRGPIFRKTFFFFLFLGGSPNSHLSFNDSMMHAACPALGRMIKPVGSWHWCSVLLLLGHLGRYLGALSGEHGAIWAHAKPKAHLNRISSIKVLVGLYGLAWYWTWHLIWSWFRYVSLVYYFNSLCFFSTESHRGSFLTSECSADIGAAIVLRASGLNRLGAIKIQRKD